MLAKCYRLRKNSEFVATYAQRKYVSDKYLILNTGKQKPIMDLPSKVAFVVSKKTDKRAVVRNKIKRRMREAYYELLKTNTISPVWISLIFSAKKTSVDATYEEIKSSMLTLIGKVYEKYD